MNERKARADVNNTMGTEILYDWLNLLNYVCSSKMCQISWLQTICTNP